MTDSLCSTTNNLESYDKTAIASMPQNVVFVQYSISTAVNILCC